MYVQAGASVQLAVSNRSSCSAAMKQSSHDAQREQPGWTASSNRQQQLPGGAPALQVCVGLGGVLQGVHLPRVGEGGRGVGQRGEVPFRGTCSLKRRSACRCVFAFQRFTYQGIKRRQGAPCPATLHHGAGPHPHARTAAARWCRHAPCARPA